MTDERLNELITAFPELVAEIYRLRRMILEIKPDAEPTPELDRHISVLELPLRTEKALNREGGYNEPINTLRELIGKSEQDLLSIRNFGVGSLRMVIEKLHAIGLRLKNESGHYST